MPRPRAKSIGRNVQAIRRSLESIARSLTLLVPALDAAAQNRTSSARRGRKLRLSPARRAGLKLQGQYMGYLRNLPPRQKSRVKALRTTGGVRAAIKLAKQLSRKGRG